MIHFFPTFSRDADASPLGDELRRTGIPYRILAGHVRFQYRHRLSMLLRGYPKLAWFAVKSAGRSLFLSDPSPKVVVLGSDIEVLIFSFVRLVRGGQIPSIVLMGFIYTSRSSGLVNALRRAYFRMVLRNVRCVICHSTLEVARYGAMFAGVGAKFAFVPWGTNVAGRQEYLRTRARYQRPVGRIAVLSAGRSGRDYRTLVEAVRDLDVSLTIVCDRSEALAGITENAQVRVLRDCYDERYLAELGAADIVVVPLAVEDISAGQMVIIQAMAYGKPTVVTRTPTVSEYLEDGRTALLVERANAKQMRETIQRLVDDPALRERLGRAALMDYEWRFSQAAVVRNTIAAIQQYCALG
jgi:glycosyltransferase involved in cell wall biosynthesis